MNKIQIGQIYGKTIYTGNVNMLREGDYYISMEGKVPSGLFVKHRGELVPVCKCNNQKNELNLQDVNIMAQCHGKTETIVPSEGYDGIGSVSYKKPKIEDKDSVTITKNGVTEIKVGKGYDGMSDITVIVNIENNE